MHRRHLPAAGQLRHARPVLRRRRTALLQHRRLHDGAVPPVVALRVGGEQLLRRPDVLQRIDVQRAGHVRAAPDVRRGRWLLQRRSDLLQRSQLHVEHVPAAAHVPVDGPVVLGRPDVLQRADVHHGHVPAAAALRGRWRRVRLRSDLLHEPELPDGLVPAVRRDGRQLRQQQPVLRDRLLRPKHEHVPALRAARRLVRVQLAVLQQQHLLPEHLPELRGLAAVLRFPDLLRRAPLHGRQLLHRARERLHGRPPMLLRLLLPGIELQALRQRGRWLRGRGAGAVLPRSELQHERDLPGQLARSSPCGWRRTTRSAFLRAARGSRGRTSPVRAERSR